MSMNPDPQGQRPGLFGRIGNFFTQGDPNAGQATDPFANLSRAQRTMLGFAALRDAAASLEGRDSNYFAQAMGGFESARERERLRDQGIFQNQVGALQALAQIEQQIALAQSYGMPVSPAMTQMRDMLMGTLGQGGAMPAGGAEMPMQPPGDFTGGVVPQGLPSGPQGDIGAPPTGVVYEPGSAVPQPYDGEPEIVQTGGEPMPADPLAQLNAERDDLMRQMQLRLAAGGQTRDLEFLLDENRLAREALAAGQAAQAEEQQQIEQQAQRAETVVTPEIDAAMNFLVRGFDEQGDPVFNPALTTRAGRLVSGALESPEYQSFAGALETLRVDTLIDTLQNVTAGALSDAEREAFSAAQGQLDPRNPIGTYRALQRMQRIAQDAMARAGRSQQGGNVPTVTWD
jgi:hypothetical protein